MKGLLPLFLGIFGTFAFSWAGLTFIPNYQIGHLDPQMDDEGNDVYPAPKSGMAERGRKVYAANGCVYCHSQQLRADYAASDIDRKWGERRSAPRDYIFDRPILLGKTRLGPDLANVGKRPLADEKKNVSAPSAASTAPSPAAANASPAAAPVPAASPVGSAAPSPGLASTSPPGAPSVTASPVAAPAGSSGANASTVAAAPPPEASSAVDEKALAPDGTPLTYTAAWHHRHLYNPRSIAPDSNMPAFRFLYEKRRIGGEPASDTLNFVGDDRDRPPEGWEIVPGYDAKCLVAYLMSLDQTHELKEVKSMATAPTVPAKGVK